jgi:OOP family OmpA-OmpF porin
MSWRHVLGAATAALMLTTPVAAQRAGSVDIGAYGVYPQFDQSLQFTNKAGFGGQIGVFFVNNLAIEADISRTSTSQDALPADRDVSVMPLRLRLTYNIPIGPASRLMFGAGYVRTRLGDFFDNSESGIGGLAGLKIGIGERFVLRFQGTMDYITGSLINDPTVDHNINFGLSAGAGVLLAGGWGPKDGDKDGVPDKTDLCPATPVGAQVDANGCPDTDRDGVRDNADRCAGTEPGKRVDATGCPIADTDGDGVLDDVDRCQNTPAGAVVDASGCPVDADGDGVTDAADRCPDTPRGERVDGTGCPTRDSDGDGVVDHLDRCPDTPQGMLVGPNGCLVVFGEGQRSVVLEGVNFIVNSAELTLDAKKVLDFVAQSLNANPDVRFEIQGHASSEGSDAYNLRLSDRRAASVRAYLISKGVDAGRMTSKGYGESQPIADNSTEEGRKQNRRVALVRTDTGR